MASAFLARKGLLVAGSAGPGKARANLNSNAYTITRGLKGRGLVQPQRGGPCPHQVPFPPLAQLYLHRETSFFWSECTATIIAFTHVSECPRCGYNIRGDLSCCGTGGSWEDNCRAPDTVFKHTWREGYKVCATTTPKPPKKFESNISAFLM